MIRLSKTRKQQTSNNICAWSQIKQMGVIFTQMKLVVVGRQIKVREYFNHVIKC